MKFKEFKEKWDPVFDKMFFSDDFKSKMIEKFKFSPAGLTIDSREKNNGVFYFSLCCKRYGYDFNEADHVIGDYMILHNKFLEDNFIEIRTFVIDYVYYNYRDIYDELLKTNYDFM